MENIQEAVKQMFRRVGGWRVSLFVMLMAFMVTVVRGLVTWNTVSCLVAFEATYGFLAFVLGVVCLRNWRRTGFLLSHVGLLVVIVYGAIGSREIKRMKMTVGTEEVQS